eukprot:gene1871-2447_t
MSVYFLELLLLASRLVNTVEQSIWLEQLQDNSAWIFQMPSTLTIVANAKVIIINPNTTTVNVYWYAGSSATIAANAQMIGS